MSGYYSRGSLSSLAGRKVISSPEDDAWAKKVLAACMDPQGSICVSDDYFYENDLSSEVESISLLWGIYRRPEPIFNDKYFSPRGR